MKKILTGYLFNRIEKIEDREFNHIGFEDDEKIFGDLLASFVPEIASKKRAKLTIELLDDDK
jgi:hypothetical protein